MGMLKYEKYGYQIIRTGDGFVVYNKRKPFGQGHTHLRSYKSCIDVINFCMSNFVPLKADKYYLISLQRITTNVDYYNRLAKRIQEVEEHGRYCSEY